MIARRPDELVIARLSSHSTASEGLGYARLTPRQGLARPRGLRRRAASGLRADGKVAAARIFVGAVGPLSAAIGSRLRP